MRSGLIRAVLAAAACLAVSLSTAAARHDAKRPGADIRAAEAWAFWGSAKPDPSPKGNLVRSYGELQVSFRETLNVDAVRQCELEHTSERRNVKDSAESSVPSLMERSVM